MQPYLSLLLTFFCLPSSAILFAADSIGLKPDTVMPCPCIGGVNSAIKFWHMDGGSKLEVRGETKLGIALTGEDKAASLTRGGDGFVAQLDGGHLVLDDLGDVFDHGEYTLHLRVKPAGEQLDGTLFSRWAGRDHMPVDFSAWRMPWGHLSTRGISFRTSFKRTVAAGQAAVLDFYCPTPEPLTGWLDLTVRLTPKTGTPGLLDLFVNGELVFQNAEKLPGGLPFEFFLHETPGAIIGAQPGGRWPFRGLMDHVALWTRALSDAEVLALAAVKHEGADLQPQRRHTRRTRSGSIICRRARPTAAGPN